MSQLDPQTQNGDKINIYGFAKNGNTEYLKTGALGDDTIICLKTTY